MRLSHTIAGKLYRVEEAHIIDGNQPRQLCIKSLAGSPVRNNLLLLELKTFDQSIPVTKEKKIILIQSHVDSAPHHPPIRNGIGDPDLIEIYFAESGDLNSWS